MKAARRGASAWTARRQRPEGWDIRFLDGLHHRQFEEAVRHLMRRDGAHDAVRVGGAGDNGADIKGTDPAGRRWVVQCKHRRDRAAGAAVGTPDLHVLNGTGRPVLWQHEPMSQGRPARHCLSLLPLLAKVTAATSNALGPASLGCAYSSPPPPSRWSFHAWQAALEAQHERQQTEVGQWGLGQEGGVERGGHRHRENRGEAQVLAEHDAAGVTGVPRAPGEVFSDAAVIRRGSHAASAGPRHSSPSD
ncbi:restriction endonuclease [Streptomyces sp. NPDC059496]|uniref:restriction endonuclease n=1 Tax=Streptomyces sp. NPDC059496 TaxID=3346851 RepID=UPI0036B5B12F